MPLIDLAYSDKEREEYKEKLCPVDENYQGPKYPWGLEFSLEGASLEKLGLDIGDFKIGQEVPLNGVARVVGLDQHEREDDDNHRCVRLVITMLDNGKQKSSKEVADKLYDER